MKQYAVITGASQGLGKAFAEELAQLHKNLILVSLPNENLAELSHELSTKYSINVLSYELDLTQKEEVLKFTEELNHKFQIFFLINNAGIGGTEDISKIGIDYIYKIIDLNIIGATTLTHQLLPNLLRQEQSYILNISSLAALSPIGYKTVYPASKAFINHFSLGLREELKNTSVSVSVVHPGAMATNERVSKRIREQGFLGKITQLFPEKVARKCVRQTLQKKRTIIVNRGSWTMMQILPNRLKTYLITNGVKKEVNM